MKTKQFETQLGTFSAQVRPGKPLIVFLNGAGNIEACDNFALIINQLSPEYGIFAIDYLDNGRSGLAQKNYTLADEAQKIAQFIKLQDSESIAIVAHSIGGIYARYLVQELANVRGLVLIEPTTRKIMLNPPQTPDYLAAQEQPITLDSLKSSLSEIFSTRLVKKIVKSITTPPAEHDQFFTEIQQQNFNQLLLSNHSQLTAESVVIFTQPYRLEEYQRSEFKTSNTEIVPIGATHYLHWHYSKQLTQAIVDLIKP